MEKKENQISALIFTMNNPELVSILLKLYKHFDEIVVIDSSNLSIHDLLKQNIKKIDKAKKIALVRLPPIGYPDLYYLVGVNLCSSPWIIHVDDDEELSYELLAEIKRLIEEAEKDNIVGYRIRRIEAKTGSTNFLLRFFKKDSIWPSGAIHWVWDRIKDPQGRILYVHPSISSSKDGHSNLVKNLTDPRYYILHKELNLNEGSVLKKIRKYAIIDAYQAGYKFLVKLDTGNVPAFLRKIYWRLSKSLGKKAGLIICTTLNILLEILLGLTHKNRKRALRITLYKIAELINVLSNTLFKEHIWEKMYSLGGVIQALDLYGIEKVPKLPSEKGLENYLHLMRNLYLKN